VLVEPYADYHQSGLVKLPRAAHEVTELTAPLTAYDRVSIGFPGVVRDGRIMTAPHVGTGLGSAVFSNGALAPHLELAQHPIHTVETYNDYVGNGARHALSKRKWNKRVLKVIEMVRSLLHYDVLYLGEETPPASGLPLPENVHIASNDADIPDGVRLWDEAVSSGILGSRRRAVRD
jgi:polyphosphate glucokinase